MGRGEGRYLRWPWKALRSLKKRIEIERAFGMEKWLGKHCQCFWFFITGKMWDAQENLLLVIVNKCRKIEITFALLSMRKFTLSKWSVMGDTALWESVCNFQDCPMQRHLRRRWILEHIPFCHHILMFSGTQVWCSSPRTYHFHWCMVCRNDCWNNSR